MFDPRSIVSPRLKRLYDYWVERCGGRAFPARADIDPVDIPWALGDIALIEVLESGDFRWRLDGTNLVEFFGCDLTGRTLSEYPYPAYVDTMRRTLRAAAELRAPSSQIRRFSNETFKWNYETLFLPLSSDGERVDMLIQMLEIERR